MRGGNTEEINIPCVQGSHPGRDCLQNSGMDPQSPVSAWQYHHPVITKSEPLDETEMVYQMNKNIQYSSASQTRNSYYSPSVRTSNSMDYQNNASASFLYNHVPLTPPDSEPMVSPQNQGPSPSPPTESIKTNIIQSLERRNNVVKTEPSSPRATQYNQSMNGPVSPSKSQDSWATRSPPLSNSSLVNGPLQILEQSLEKSDLLAKRRDSASSSEDGENKRSAGSEFGIPKVNASGKIKTWKCKQCNFAAETKIESWEHAKIHIKPEKLLTCPTCPFVTEFKHHLEYHILNHSGRKPYKCDQCEYRCVNKSMLSSHAKCHSDIHQYRCLDCTYASKYCHSLKLHLRKYGHRPSKVLNPDGSENPYPIIDVYGTRRGPKMKQPSQPPLERMPNSPSPQNPQLLPYPIPPQFMFPTPQFQQFFPLPFVNGFPPNPVLLQNLQRLVQERQAEAENENNQTEDSNRTPSPPTTSETEVLDLSKPGTSGDTPKNRRKGRAFKYNDIPMDSSDENDDEETTTIFSNVEVVQNDEEASESRDKTSEAKMETQETENDSNNNKTSQYNCQNCGITFSDDVLHTIHMGFHGFNEPFTCNVCGQRCKDKVEFHLHILRPRHQHGES